jgi:hypothetical protein
VRVLVVLYIKALFHHAAGLASLGSTAATYMPEWLRKRFGLKPEQRKITLDSGSLVWPSSGS